MDVKGHYKHCRKLGAFSASDCLALARKAAALDEAAKIKKMPPYAVVGAEYAYGSWRIFSRGIKVY